MEWKIRRIFIPLVLTMMLALISATNISAQHYSVTPINADKNNINDLAFVPGKSTLLAISDDSDLLICDINGNIVHDKKFPSNLYSVAVHPSGAMAAAGGRADDGINATLYIISPITGQITREISTDHGSIYCLEFSHDSSLLVVTTGDGTMLLLNTTNFSIYREKALGEKIFSASFSPYDDALVIGDAAGRLHIYWPGNDSLKSITAHSDRVYDTLWPADDTLLSCGKDGVIKIFGKGLKELRVLTAHDDTVLRLGGSSGGRYVLSGGNDGRTVIWDMKDNSVAFELGSAKYFVESNAVSRDGRYACYGTSDSQIFIVSLDPDDDGYLLLEDDFPNDPAASSDSDDDGSPDDWNEEKSVVDSTSGLHLDHFPGDPAASLDTDEDGFPDEWNSNMTMDDSNSNISRLDDFPSDPAASLDTDGDGSPDEWNIGKNGGDSITDLELDIFPSDPDEWADSDWPFADGIGDNADRFPGFNNYVFYILIVVSVVIVMVIIVLKIRSGSGRVTFTSVGEISDEEKVEQKSLELGHGRQIKMKAVDGRIERLVPNYLITHKLGSGSFASVYQANSLEGGKVAIKLPKLLDETLDSSIYEKFESEAKIWKKLEHQNIVELCDAGTDPIPYMVMELMEGGNLKLLLAERELTVEESVNIMLGLLDAMSFAHRMATVHRDIKPENILFTGGGQPKISDWGIGKFMASENVTESSGHKGTLAYSAPEQVSPKKYGKVDWSTDMFQLGTVFYEMLTGLNPFMGEDPAEVISNILYTDVEPPSSINPNIPRGIDEIVMRALSREKRERWRSTDVMYERLKEMVR